MSEMSAIKDEQKGEQNSGKIIAAYGRQYLVEFKNAENGEKSLVHAFPRGKKSEFACGDCVEISHQSNNQARIEALKPRETLLYRKDMFRQKLIAANVTQIIMVVASEPSFSIELVYRALIAAQAENIRVLIILNKCDLDAKKEAALAQLKPIKTLAYEILELSALENCDALLPFLDGQKSVLVGQSGMGKSTIVNTLIPAAQIKTREISEALDSGKHTTTYSHLYYLNEHSTIIDCPGLQEFGLHHLSPEAIWQGFPEFIAFIGKCRFRNCQHNKEPECAIREASENGLVNQTRYALFRALYKNALEAALPSNRFLQK